MMYRLVFKKIIDYSVALCALIILLPVLIIITILLYFLNHGKPFFTQLRPGKNNEIFRLIKFKTMNDKVGIDGVLLSDSERITKIGKFVRKTSLDELPQLVNVIKGDMSLIGPRPLLIEYLPLYNETQKRRHEVRPGITGWAQVNGRNAISWTQKFDYDVWYVDNQTFWLDIKILFLTVLKVFKSEGISSNASVTMEAFTGNG
jgi:undecaprenyl phosphate N,N'-diacetylbacillosamine 1-phosphate transferase